MSTLPQPRQDGNILANISGGPSATRSQAAISSAAQAAGASWQQKISTSLSGSSAQSASTPESSSGTSEATLATTASQTDSSAAATPRRDDTAVSRPRTGGSGDSGSHSQGTRMEELGARPAAATIPNGDATRENPLCLRLRDTYPTGEYEVEIDLRILEAPGAEAAAGSPQGIGNSADTTITFTSQPGAVQEPPKCTICWEPFTTRATLMPCGHEFDRECILPWFQAIIQENHWGVILTCPLCRQRATLIRHAYTSSSDFETLNLIMHFLRTGRTESGASPVSSSTAPSLPRPRGPGAVPPIERYRGRLEDLILSRRTEDRLDLEHINSMGPHQLETFVSFLRGHSTRTARLNREHLRVLGERRSRFMGLLGDAAPSARQRRSQPIYSFPGFTRQDSLDWDAINRMNREELARFRIIIIRDLAVRVSWEDLQWLYQRSFELENPAQLRDRPRNNPVSYSE